MTTGQPGRKLSVINKVALLPLRERRVLIYGQNQHCDHAMHLLGRRDLTRFFLACRSRFYERLALPFLAYFLTLDRKGLLTRFPKFMKGREKHDDSSRMF